MIARFSSFETRRWLVALTLAAGLVVLQIVHAARVTGSEAAPAPAAPIGPAPATPALLVDASGVVVAVGGGLLAVRERTDAAPVAFAAGTDTLVTRDGASTDLDALRPGDTVRMTVDGRAGRVLQVRADAAPMGWTERLAALGPIAAIALVLAGALLVARLRGFGQAFAVPSIGRRLAPLSRPFNAPLVSRTRRTCGA